ncbi:uncharacterized protein LOC134235134, partial [Saccostrea cucullata]|uniref:uncharacterized protein LOC134235134 n=1 Tax=Saccostrea cuccullata TaxID=36930 RepID=UPI002ED1F259
MHSDILGENLEASVNIDACDGKVSVGLEKYHWTDKLLGYKFGEVKHVSLMGMVNLDYIITDLETFFGVTLNLSICFESHKACEKVFQVFNEHKLHKPFCNWTRGFVIS